MGLQSMGLYKSWTRLSDSYFHFLHEMPGGDMEDVGEDEAGKSSWRPRCKPTKATWFLSKSMCQALGYES